MTRNYLWVGFGVLADRDSVIEGELKRRGFEVIPRAERKTGKLLRDYEFRYTNEMSKLKEITQAYNEIRHAPDFYDKVPAREIAQDAIADMINTDGLEVKICTSYSTEHIDEISQKIKWISRNFKSLENSVFIIPESTPTGPKSKVKRTDRDMLRTGYFITTDESYKSVMKGPALFVLEEACFGKTSMPLISFRESSPNYWHNILVDKATKKIVPAFADETQDESTKLSL
jgi:hypothetical protein